MRKYFVLLVVVFFFISFEVGYGQTEREAVIATVQKFFTAMEGRDTALTKAVLLSEGQYFSIKEDTSQVLIRKTTHSEYLDRLTTAPGTWLEKMREPQVHIHDRVAILWTQYDFYVDGQFSHCGVDAFSLLKTAEGWKIAGFIFNIERTGCDK